MDDARLRAGLDLAADDLAATPADAYELPVPTCPGWTVTRLLDHVGRVQRSVATHLRTAPGEEVPRPPRRGEDEDPVTWLQGGTADLRAALDAVDPDTPVPFFGTTAPARAWLRRQCHEALVHGTDARLARGLDPIIPADLAVDAVDELLELVLAARFDAEAFAATGETVHLHATDAEGEWLVAFPADGPPSVEHVHAKGDVALRAPAADLLLVLASRRDLDGLEAFGDTAILTRFQSAAAY